jgi:dCMP deaminase
MTNWDRRFLDVAALIATWSKDPSSKVGCVIVRPDNTIASTGYNGYPRGMNDSTVHDRETKLKYTIHAEINAILAAHEPVRGYRLYCTMYPCERCAVQIIQAGIKEVIIPNSVPEEFYAKWKDNIETALSMFKEAQVPFWKV